VRAAAVGQFWPRAVTSAALRPFETERTP